jgi:hypothetical protein
VIDANLQEGLEQTTAWFAGEGSQFEQLRAAHVTAAE